MLSQRALNVRANSLQTKAEGAGKKTRGKIQKESNNLAQSAFPEIQPICDNDFNFFLEIRLRKKNRTSLLDLLREKVIQKMDALDER